VSSEKVGRGVGTGFSAGLVGVHTALGWFSLKRYVAAQAGGSLEGAAGA
jgi:hypothetical protein